MLRRAGPGETRIRGHGPVLHQEDMVPRELGPIPTGNGAALPPIALEALGETPGPGPRRLLLPEVGWRVPAVKPWSAGWTS